MINNFQLNKILNFKTMIIGSLNDVNELVINLFIIVSKWHENNKKDFAQLY